MRSGPPFFPAQTTPLIQKQAYLLPAPASPRSLTPAPYPNVSPANHLQRGKLIDTSAFRAAQSPPPCPSSPRKIIPSVQHQPSSCPTLQHLPPAALLSSPSFPPKNPDYSTTAQFTASTANVLPPQCSGSLPPPCVALSPYPSFPPKKPHIFSTGIIHHTSLPPYPVSLAPYSKSAQLTAIFANALRPPAPSSPALAPSSPALAPSPSPLKTPPLIHSSPSSPP